MKIVLVLLVLVCGCSARGETTWAVDALLKAGRARGIPLGIVWDEKRTLLKNVDAGDPGSPNAIGKIVRQLPGYEVRSEGGVTVVQPGKLPRRSARLLNLVVDGFGDEPATLTGFSEGLWMRVEVRIRKPPPRGFLWDILGGVTDTEVLPPLNLKRASVRKLLNAIVSVIPGGGAWELLSPPMKIQDAAQAELWDIIRYTPASQSIRGTALGCFDQK